MNAPLVTVVVCTYNHASLLALALESLRKQDDPGAPFEVLVVNNNSTDDTPLVSKRFCDTDERFRAVQEPAQGLAHARNRGYREARGTYVAYLDDDARANPSWVHEMVNFIRRHPEAVAFGGPYHRFALQPIPRWLPEDFGTVHFTDEERPIQYPTEWISGSNMVFKRDVLARLGGFSPRLGMRGRRQGYGEETALQSRIAATGEPIYYVPRMQVLHLLSEDKFHLRWHLMRAIALGRDANEPHRKEWTLTHHLVTTARKSVGGVRRLVTSRGTPWRGRLLHALHEPLFELGALVNKLSAPSDGSPSGSGEDAP